MFTSSLQNINKDSCTDGTEWWTVAISDPEEASHEYVTIKEGLQQLLYTRSNIIM